jgi:hypothetical protein
MGGDAENDEQTSDFAFENEMEVGEQQDSPPLADEQAAEVVRRQLL